MLERYGGEEMQVGKTHIEITDNSDLAKEEMQAAVLRALEKCGLTAERYAKMLQIPDTGNLRNSITHKVQPSEPAVYVGTNVEYGVYVELGTGKYYPGGRDEPWVYQDEKGNWHRTEGQKAKPFIKPAIADHVSDYKNIIQNELKG